MSHDFFTPKALHSKAQGQRRSRATLGKDYEYSPYPKGVAPSVWYNAFGVKKSCGIDDPGCAEAATLGFGIKPLRGKSRTPFIDKVSIPT